MQSVLPVDCYRYRLLFAHSHPFLPRLFPVLLNRFERGKDFEVVLNLGAIIYEDLERCPSRL